MTGEGELFSRIDTTKKSYLRTKSTAPTHDADLGPRIIKLPEGVVPDFVKLTPYQEFCWRTMGKMVTRHMKPNPRLELTLLQAHLRLRQEEYTAYVWMSTLIVGVVALVASLLFGGVLISFLGVETSMVLIFSVMIVVLPIVLTYVVMESLPKSKAKTRMRDINKRIGAAMSFISAMASADVNVDIIFKELSRQPIYGEIKNEAEWITRDTELLGADILTAVNRAAQRTPSPRFQEFLQGVVTTSTSGGQLKPYFLQKAQQYEKESKLEVRAQLETLGLMAETFVTVVVAFPLFLIVIMAIMAIVPGSGGNTDTTIILLYLVVLLMVPFSQFGFIFFIWNMTKESTM
jgi:archaeal flagellar protein FlaJ